MSLSAHRTALHEGQASQRKLSPDYEKIGLSGETAFALQYGFKLDQSDQIAGDGGVDFIIPLAFTVDVKTAQKHRLLVEQGKVRADIYVLAGYKDGTATLLGWEWAANVKKVSPVDTGRGVINHYLDAADLRPMAELEDRLMVLKQYKKERTAP